MHHTPVKHSCTIFNYNTTMQKKAVTSILNKIKQSTTGTQIFMQFMFYKSLNFKLLNYAEQCEKLFHSITE